MSDMPEPMDLDNSPLADGTAIPPPAPSLVPPLPLRRFSARLWLLNAGQACWQSTLDNLRGQARLTPENSDDEAEEDEQSPIELIQMQYEDEQEEQEEQEEQDEQDKDDKDEDRHDKENEAQQEINNETQSSSHMSAAIEAAAAAAYERSEEESMRRAYGMLQCVYMMNPFINNPTRCSGQRSG